MNSLTKLGQIKNVRKKDLSFDLLLRASRQWMG